MKKRLPAIALLTVFYVSLHAQTILGLDVSHYQGTITWSQVKSPGGKTFAWAKATEGVSYTDPNYVTNATNGTAGGVVMGAYHFARPESNTAAAEAAYFVSVAGPYIGAGNLPPALDLEDPPGGTALTSYFTSAALTTWVQTWMTAVQNATGVKPVIYISGSVASYLNSSLNTYGLWIADPDGSATAQPANIGVWSTWMFKQYSWTGTVSGVSGTGNNDLDVFNGTTTAFNNLIGTVIAVSPAFTASTTTVCEGSTVTFTDHSTSTGTITAHSWTFSGGTPGTSTSTNPAVTYSTAGTYNVKEVVTSSTGKDSVTKTGYIHVIPTSTLPLSQTFQSSTFPPTGWTMNFQNPTDSAWQLCTYDGYNSSQCMYFPANCGYVHSTAGQKQQLYTPDYSFVGATNPKMWFEVAYEPYNNTYSDTLAIYYSTDCGSTWNNVYFKGGMTLCSTGFNVASGTDTSGGRGCFAPPTAQAWRADTINLASLAGNSSVMFSIESRSGWGNILYIDNINIASTTPVSCTPPATPVAVSPGTASGPGSSVSTVTLQWDTAAGAVTYYPRVSQCPYGTPNIIWYDNCYAGTTESVSLPAGNLYRWNLGAYSECGNSACVSNGNTLYFTIPPVLVSTGNTTFCPGDSVKLTTTAGNTVSTPEYYWYLNGNLVDSSASGTYYAKQAGSYTAAISYSCGITGRSNAVPVNLLTQPATPVILASPGITACGPVQLTAASNGCVGCTYQWSNGATGSPVTVTTTGTYRVTATSGCASTGASVAVTINQPPVVSASASLQQVCTGQPVTLTATGNGTSYQWSGTGLQTSTGSSVNAVVSSTGSQTYTVTATLNSCTATASTSVSYNTSIVPAVTITQVTANPVCVGSQVAFSASGTNGGSSPVYQWTTSNSQAGTGNAFNLANAVNGVTVRCLLISNATCASPDSVYSNTLTLAAQAAQPVAITISTPDTNVCSGENIAFTSTENNGGNSPAYNWYVNGSSTGTGSGYTLNNIQTGSAVYCVLTSSASCVTGSPATSNTVNLHIQTTVQASVSITPATETICAGTSVTFTATPGNGGNSPQYTWQLNGNTVGANSTTYTNAGLQNGDVVSCSMTSSSSCVTNPDVSSNTVTAQVNPLPVINAGGPFTLHTGGIVALGGNPTASGGATPYTYAWSPATGLSSSSTANPSDSGITTSTTYTVLVTDSKGCTASSSCNVNVIPCTLQTPAVQVNFCDMATPMLTGAAYQWLLQGQVINGATTRFYSATQSGYYNVRITDTTGCIAQSTDTYMSYPACLTTDIASVADNPEFEIYPNPASNELVVSFSNTASGSGHIEIFDILGHLVYSSHTINIISGNKYAVSIGTLAAGSYLLRVMDNQNRFVAKRFIKM